MKKNRFYILLAALLLASTPVFAGGGSAKNLAKQTLNLNKKAVELQSKAAEIEEKALALSDRDRRTYQAELERLGFQPPAGLFNDGDALLTGAPEAPEGPGGIAGLIAGLLGGGGNSRGGTTARSSGSSSPTTAASGGSTATPPQVATPTAPSSGTTAPPTPTPTPAPSTPAAAPSGILGGRTGAFFNIFDSKNYHMKTRTNVQGMEMIQETFIKGDMMATLSETMGMSTRMVRRDGMVYVIYDAMRTIMVMPITDSSGSPTEEPLQTAGMIVTGSGTARFDGRNLFYEEYSLSTGSGDIKSQFFLDGNNLAGIRVITGIRTIETVDMVVLDLDQNVPNSVFELPAGYQRMEMPQMPSGY